MAQQQCKLVHYIGRVQGVGFRATARHLAEGFAVAGYVRNLPDGSVELVAEGESEQVDAFLGAVTRSLSRYIDRAEASELTPGGLQGFHVRY